MSLVGMMHIHLVPGRRLVKCAWPCWPGRWRGRVAVVVGTRPESKLVAVLHRGFLAIASSSEPCSELPMSLNAQ